MKTQFTLILLFVIQSSVANNLASGTDLQAEILAHSQALKSPPFEWQDIIQEPNLKTVKLSPNGQHLVYLLAEQRGASLWLMDTANLQHKKLFHSLIITDVHWSYDSQLLYLQSDSNMAYLDLKNLQQPEIFVKLDHQNNESFFDLDNSTTNHILIQREIKELGKNTQYQLLRVALDGQETLLYSGDKRIYDLLFDQQGQLQFIRYPGDNQHHIAYLKDQQKHIVYSAPVIDKIRMIRFDQEHNELILVGYHDADLISIHAYNIVNKTSRLIHHDPDQIANLNSAVIDPLTDEILAVSYFTDRLKTYAFDPTLVDDINIINQSLSASVLISPNSSGSYWLVQQSGASIGPNKYYLYNTKNQQLIEILAEQRTNNLTIDPSNLPKAIAISYAASDGMLIHGYVMLPKGYDLQQVPLLTYVHGGPFNRYHGGYSPWQYLVNKGYALFIPNFRASKGYGIKYMTAGKTQFSGRVQQDIIDGINYLIYQGISKPGNLGVFGHSFGGYSVLALMSHYPDFFKAGFASAGPTELVKPLLKLEQKDINRYDGIPLIEALPILMVDLDNQQAIDQMYADSPAAMWQHIKNPLMIWAGEQDVRVPVIDV